MPNSHFVRIVATPGGEAPPEVREAWVGLTLPLFGSAPRTIETIGVVSHTKQPPRVGYVVEGMEAVKILAKKSTKAATWWLEQAPHVVVAGYLLVFSVEVCEVV